MSLAGTWGDIFLITSAATVSAAYLQSCFWQIALIVCCRLFIIHSSAQ